MDCWYFQNHFILNLNESNEFNKNALLSPGGTVAHVATEFAVKERLHQDAFNDVKQLVISLLVVVIAISAGAPHRKD